LVACHIINNWIYFYSSNCIHCKDVERGVDKDTDMSDNILSKAEALCHLPLNGGHFADRYLDISRIVAKLVAEVKRLRGSMEDLELICAADEQRYKEQLAAKDAEINELQWIKTYRIDEKELQFQCIVTKLNAEIHKWQEIAIEAKAANIYYSAQPIFKTWEQFPEEACHCRTKASCRERAAKELSLPHDNYLSRLEQAFTKLYILHLRGMDKDVAKKHAQEALEKIRHADSI